MQASHELGREMVIARRPARAGVKWAAARRLAYGPTALPTFVPEAVFEPLMLVATAVGFTLPGVTVGALVAVFGPRDTETHCRTCGYDLTGNASGRCPECGTPIKPMLT